MDRRRAAGLVLTVYQPAAHLVDYRVFYGGAALHFAFGSAGHSLAGSLFASLWQAAVTYQAAAGLYRSGINIFFGGSFSDLSGL